MNQLWMPSLSICQSLSELDDAQLKVAATSAENLLSKVTSKSEDEINVNEQLEQLIKLKVPITKWYSQYRMFLKAYLGFAKEEMQYRFSDTLDITRYNIYIPNVYHTCYHQGQTLLCCSQLSSKLEGDITKLNFLTREVLCKRWKDAKTNSLWTKRRKPKWYCETRPVFEMLGKLYNGNTAFVYNKDGSISPEGMPCMIYKKIANDRIEFVGLNIDD